MKHIKVIFLAILINTITGSLTKAQTMDSLGLPGDNLNLYGVLFLFKESKTVEEFETKLNTKNNKINNLDLNHDGETDYIRVIDYGKNGLHILVLTDPITAKESQDLATIEIEQKGNGVAHIQIVGDEDLYGKNYIIEPKDIESKEETAPTQNSTNTSVIINVWSWPGVQYVYGPSYSYWSSPWYWGYYPAWWSPWYTTNYYVYWQGTYRYRNYHRRVYNNRMIAAHNVYYSRRRESKTVHNNIHNQIYYGPRKTNGNTNPRNNKNTNREHDVKNNGDSKPNRNKTDERESHNPNPLPGKNRQQREKPAERVGEPEKRGGHPNPQPNSPRQDRSKPSENRSGNPNPQQKTPRQENRNPNEKRGGSPNPKPNSPKQERTKPAENRGGGNPNPQPNSRKQSNPGQENRGGGGRK